MTTLPPEGNENAAEQPGQVPEVPAAPPVPPAAPAPGYAAPQQPGFPPQAPPAPPAPPAPGYGAPQQGYAQPGNGQPGYNQGAPVSDPMSNLTLNYWLSVVFAWLPALIFYIIEKDKGNAQSRALHTANLNFSLLRTGVALVGSIFAGIPVLGWLILLVAVIANIGLFVLHIIAATKVQEAYRAGQPDPFMFNIPLVK